MEANLGGDVVLLHPQHERLLMRFVSDLRPHSVHFLSDRAPTARSFVRQKFWKTKGQTCMTKDDGQRAHGNRCPRTHAPAFCPGRFRGAEAVEREYNGARDQRQERGRSPVHVDLRLETGGGKKKEQRQREGDGKIPTIIAPQPTATNSTRRAADEQRKERRRDDAELLEPE